MTWLLSSSSDRRALDVVDGAGPHEGRGPHYSRRTPGSKTFTGVAVDAGCADRVELTRIERVPPDRLRPGTCSEGSRRGS